jgi:hypothetical protein
MLQIKNQYKGVNVEYLLGNVRVTKKIEQLTEKDIENAKKWGLNLGKYFEEEVENTELPSISYQGVEQPKPKRKRK